MAKRKTPKQIAASKRNIKKAQAAARRGVKKPKIAKISKKAHNALTAGYDTRKINKKIKKHFNSAKQMDRWMLGLE